MTNEINKEVQVLWLNQAMDMLKPFWKLDKESSPEEIAEAFAEHAFKTKEEYLGWRDMYRETIKMAAALQKTWKPKRSHHESDWYFTSCVQENARIITKLIEVRRMSKVAAGIQREAALKEAQEV